MQKHTAPRLPSATSFRKPLSRIHRPVLEPDIGQNLNVSCLFSHSCARKDGVHYCSLNNRRLYVLRWAAREGLLADGKIGVRIKPMENASRHAAK